MDYKSIITRGRRKILRRLFHLLEFKLQHLTPIQRLKLLRFISNLNLILAVTLGVVCVMMISSNLSSFVWYCFSSVEITFILLAVYIYRKVELSGLESNPVLKK